MTHRLGDFFGLRVFTTQSHGQNRANIGMPRQSQHETNGIRVVVATRKADDMNIVFAGRNRVSDMLRAFHRVNHQNQIADSLAAVRAQVTGPTVVG